VVRRTAQKQYIRALLFSTVYDLMRQVMFCVQPSVRAAYRAHEVDVGTSIISVYNKLNGLETHTSSELVRDSAREFAPLIASMGGKRGIGSKLSIGTVLKPANIGSKHIPSHFVVNPRRLHHSLVIVLFYPRRVSSSDEI
jgi:hypothetical protein